MVGGYWVEPAGQIVTDRKMDLSLRGYGAFIFFTYFFILYCIVLVLY